MGIKSTRDIKRSTAIARILEIDALIIDKDYREIERKVSESDNQLQYLVDEAEPLNIDEYALSKWTDSMLGDQMDTPLYRYSLFDNYLIE